MSTITLYKDQLVAGYERDTTKLKRFVNTEPVEKGGSVVFTIADSNSASATKRGSDGLYPASTVNNTSVTVSMEEWTNMQRLNGFDAFKTAGNQAERLIKNCSLAIGRKTDDLIMDALSNGTQVVSGGASTDALNLLLTAATMLRNQNAGMYDDDGITAVISPAFYDAIGRTASFSSADYAQIDYMVNGIPVIGEVQRFRGVNIIESTAISGLASASESCYVFHRDAIGFAMKSSDGVMNEPDLEVGFNNEQNYSYARCTAIMGASLLQNTGVVKMLFDASAYT
ncbi:MAG: hypothetical protein CUN56_00545 [Phototrophicales bacterium]|nr:MAG: hypothetical protein CUN56_00545 [Phototrophicales bacterium]